jgi:hypothetical protein
MDDLRFRLRQSRQGEQQSNSDTVDLHDGAGSIEIDNTQQTNEQEFILLLPDTSEA